MRNARYPMILLAALLLGCNSEVKNSAPARAPAPTQTETGRFALQKMLVAAHLWARDAQPVRLESVSLPDSDGHDGKASFWRSTFASAAKQKVQTFTWSGSANPDTPRGIDHGTEDFFSPTNRTTQPWDLNYLKVDSDKAFAVAQEHGGKQLLAKKSAQPVMYLLDFDSRTPTLRWHVIYGPSPANAPLSIIVDATVGEFVHKE